MDYYDMSPPEFFGAPSKRRREIYDIYMVKGFDEMIRHIDTDILRSFVLVSRLFNLSEEQRVYITMMDL